MIKCQMQPDLLNITFPFLFRACYLQEMNINIVDWKWREKVFEIEWEIHFSLLALIWRINVHDFSCWIWKSSKQKTIPNSLNIPIPFLVPGGKQFDANFKRKGNFWGFSHLIIHSGEKSNKFCPQGNFFLQIS